MSRAARLGLTVLLLAIAVLCLGGIYRAVTVLFLHVPLDPNEGWNAYHAADAVAGRPLYPGSSPDFINNYPPLSFYLVGGIGALIGDNIVAGRILSLLSFFLGAGAIALISRRMGAGGLAALFGALFFASVLLLESDYVGMDDPQLFGHALQLGALLLVFSPAPTTTKDVAAAALCVVALFIKHNLFLLPAAVAIWLVTVHPRRARTFAGAGIAFLLLGFAAFRIVEGQWLNSVLASPRRWTFGNFRTGAETALVWIAVPLTLLARLSLRDRNSLPVKFCAIYVALAVPAGLLLLSGDGVDSNVLFDACIALSLASAVVVEDLRAANPLWKPLAAAAIVAPLGYSLVTSIDKDWLAPEFWIHPWTDEAQTATADLAFLRQRNGDAICEDLALCYWGGKRETVDVFNLSEALATSARKPDKLVSAIARRQFVTIESASVATGFPPPVNSAVRRYYVLARASDNGMFYVPR